MGTFRIAVLASGTGTNLQAILDGLHGRDGIEVVCVASNKPGARALERAANAGVETGVFPREDHGDRVERDAAMADWLTAREVELIVLAGYMELLSAEFVRRFPNRIVNVHPALLPAFPGAHAVADALAWGARVTGVTVHLVDEEVDHGPIVFQEAIPIHDGEGADSLAARIHEIEHRLLPKAVRALTEGRVRVDGRRVTIAEPAADGEPAAVGEAAPVGEPVAVDESAAVGEPAAVAEP